MNGRITANCSGMGTMMRMCGTMCFAMSEKHRTLLLL